LRLNSGQGVTMWKFIKSIRWAMAACLFFFTIYWLPKDVQDAPQAAEPWRKILSMVDQLTVFKIFAGILVLWIIWIDLRPYLYQWSDKRWPKEPQSPKLEIRIDTHIEHRFEIHGVDCKIRNVGAAGDVFAKLTPISGIQGGIFLSDLPACWRHSTARSIRLLRFQSENLHLAKLDLKGLTLSIAYAARDGQSTEWLNTQVPKGKRFHALVKLDVFCDPKNADGAIEDYIVFDLYFGEKGGGSFGVNPFPTLDAANAYMVENAARSNEGLAPPAPQGTVKEKQNPAIRGPQ
jgi:hypothetical protein